MPRIQESKERLEALTQQICRTSLLPAEELDRLGGEISKGIDDCRKALEEVRRRGTQRAPWYQEDKIEFQKLAKRSSTRVDLRTACTRSDLDPQNVCAAVLVAVDEGDWSDYDVLYTLFSGSHAKHYLRTLSPNLLARLQRRLIDEVDPNPLRCMPTADEDADINNLYDFLGDGFPSRPQQEVVRDLIVRLAGGLKGRYSRLFEAALHAGGVFLRPVDLAILGPHLSCREHALFQQMILQVIRSVMGGRRHDPNTHQALLADAVSALADRVLVGEGPENESDSNDPLQRVGKRPLRGVAGTVALTLAQGVLLVEAIGACAALEDERSLDLVVRVCELRTPALIYRALSVVRDLEAAWSIGGTLHESRASLLRGMIARLEGATTS